MTLQQGLAFTIVIGMVALFIWDRFRYDLVAVMALLAAVLVGVVPPDRAFSGFSDQIVIIVASALVVSAAVAKSGIVETLLRPVSRYLTRTGSQVVLLAGAVAFLSAFMKNIGAVAIFMPVALQLARRTSTSPSLLLMPLAFASLIGGLITLIGTSPNIIVSRMRQEIMGEPFGMFDFTPVGLAVAVVGIAFLAVGWRLLPGERRGKAAAEDLFKVEDYTTEALLPAGTALVGKTVEDLERMTEGDVRVAAIVREKQRRYVPASHWVLYEDDVLVLEGTPHALEKLVAEAHLELVGAKQIEREEAHGTDELAVIEAVVTAESLMVGRSPLQLALRRRHGVNLLAVSRSGQRSTARLNRMTLKTGDVVVLQGPADHLPDAMAALGCLPLAERNLQLGRRGRAWLPAAILAAAMALVALEAVPVTVAFFGAAVLCVVSGTLTPNEAITSVEWPIVILLGALIPVSDAVQSTGGSDLIAAGLASVVTVFPAWAALAFVVVAAMAVTPFLNNAATVLVMAPIAAGLAGRLGLNPDPFLMAVAIGAACDFLTPIGHQCNTLILGPGGYRFGDYWKLGLPLSVLVVLVSVPMLMLVWPM